MEGSCTFMRFHSVETSTSCAPTVSASRSVTLAVSTGSWNYSCAGVSPLFSTATTALPSNTRAKA